MYLKVIYYLIGYLKNNIFLSKIKSLKNSINNFFNKTYYFFLVSLEIFYFNRNNYNNGYVCTFSSIEYILFLDKLYINIFLNY